VIGGVVSTSNSLGVDPNVLKKGSFGMNLTAMEQFLLNLSSTFIITLMGESKQQDRTAFDQMLKRIAGLFVLLVDGIFKLSSLRSSANGPVFRAPPIVKPSTKAKAGAFVFTYSSYGTGLKSKRSS